MPETQTTKPKHAGGRPRKNPSETEWKAFLRDYALLKEEVAGLKRLDSEKAFVDLLIAYKGAADASRLPRAEHTAQFVAAALETRKLCHAHLDN